MASGSKNLTLEEIGRRAGVSRSTVSRVLNERPDVRPEVREKVEAVIAETGYMPNQAARALVSNKSGLVGLVILTDAEELFGDPYYSALVHGIQQGCLEHGLVFSIFPVLGTGSHANLLTRQLAQGFVDGVIVTAGPRSEGLIADLRARGSRLVVIGHPAVDEGLMRIDVDYRVGSATATRHLLDQGRRRVAYIGPIDEYVFGTERCEGYRDAIDAGGGAVEERLVHTAEPTADGGRVAAEVLLAEAPDAIYVATDTMAIGVLEVLEARGLRVPEDVAIVGFAGLPRAPRTTPRLTTVVQPVAEVGQAAVAALMGEVDAPHLTILPTRLDVNESCGALRERG